MKPVKGVEKIKASANKANKETVKPVKGISLMSLIAKSVRGVKKMDATGEKMKKVKIKENYEEFTSRKNGEEAAAKEIKTAKNKYGETFNIGDEVVTPDKKHQFKIVGFHVGKDGKTKAMRNAGIFSDSFDLDSLDKVKSRIKPGVDLGNSFDKFKDKLKEIIRKELKEIYDGRDNMNDTSDNVDSPVITYKNHNFTQNNIEQMKDWLKDLSFQDIEPEDIDDLSDEQVVKAVDRHWDGGIDNFVTTLEN
ncbi:unnamed protein product [Wuchereria bancrofti]|uniref:Uncharacterized protein n=1 Tax=Wuchereria bancrofti TaxID=6293 RepID=A0A3P7FRI4_WUCBA|nr:unnamed protein product [Wuchereria bancrofti]